MTTKSFYNSLVLLVILSIAPTGCSSRRGDRKLMTKSNVSEVQMDIHYFSCDGGPHLVLPTRLSEHWRGIKSPSAVLKSPADVLDPASDYGRACAATTTQRIALIGVGGGHAIVLRSPPMSGWARGPHGSIDLYYLEAWADEDLDALIKRAVTTTPTSAMQDTGMRLTLEAPGMLLFFAGDVPRKAVYDKVPIDIEAGTYRILEGHYQPENEEALSIYRLVR